MILATRKLNAIKLCRNIRILGPLSGFADVEDGPENRKFFRDYKERLKSRFRQLDIWMTTYLIDVI